MSTDIYFSRRGCYCQGATALRGILKLLEHHYWPSYAQNLKHAGTPGGEWHGQAKGRRADHQLTQWVRSNRSHRRRLALVMCQQAKAVVLFCRRKQWILKHAQLGVGGVALGGIGTAIDLIVWDRFHHCYRAIEVKCGFGDYFQRSLGAMLPPLHRVGDSPLHQASMQLLMGMELARRMTPPPLKLGERSGSVLLVQGKDVTEFPLEALPWCDEGLAAVKGFMDVASRGQLI